MHGSFIDRMLWTCVKEKNFFPLMTARSKSMLFIDLHMINVDSVLQLTRINYLFTSFRLILKICFSFTNGHNSLIFDKSIVQVLVSSSSSASSLYSESHLLVTNKTSFGSKHGISLSICVRDMALKISGS